MMGLLDREKVDGDKFDDNCLSQILYEIPIAIGNDCYDY